MAASISDCEPLVGVLPENVPRAALMLPPVGWVYLPPLFSSEAVPRPAAVVLAR